MIQCTPLLLVHNTSSNLKKRPSLLFFIIGMPVAISALIANNDLFATQFSTNDKLDKKIMNTAYKKTLPANVSLMANDAVWMEGAAVDQLVRSSCLNGCVRTVGMPDLHAGHNGPVGAAYAFSGVIHPGLIGTDAGCGVRFAGTTVKRSSLDALERRIRSAFDDEQVFDADPCETFRAVWRRGVKGLIEVRGIPEKIKALAELQNDGPEPGTDLSSDLSDFIDEQLENDWANSLGTIGGGNHFVEISQIEEIADHDAAEKLGLKKGKLAVVVHSGSRGLGYWLASRFSSCALSQARSDEYLAALAGALNFARANRYLLAYKALSALGAAKASKIVSTIDVVHNNISKVNLSGEDLWLHRKGSAPAYKDQPTVILASRGALSWIATGSGNEAGLFSVAHGAGRRMTRAEATAKLKQRYTRKNLSRTKLGGRVVCNNANLLYEEHPEAYKPIEPVLASLAENDMAKPVASLRPLITVKQ